MKNITKKLVCILIRLQKKSSRSKCLKLVKEEDLEKIDQLLTHTRAEFREEKNKNTSKTLKEALWVEEIQNGNGSL